MERKRKRRRDARRRIQNIAVAGERDGKREKGERAQAVRGNQKRQTDTQTEKEREKERKGV